jgi:hypothetical protein
LEEYSCLVEGFSKECDTKTLRPLIDKFNRHFWLQRKPVFKREQFAPILADHLKEKSAVPDANKDSIKIICESFEEFRKQFSQKLGRDSVPDVSLSKLLHCVHPASFWILDSRVYSVLGLWGYPTSYSGFGDLLKSLFSDHNFESFKASLEKKGSSNCWQLSALLFPQAARQSSMVQVISLKCRAWGQV